VPGAGSDSRGNRRYFTIASAPEEEYLRLGVKVYRPASTFKERLLSLRPGDSISAGQLAGDFTLPSDENKKLAFIAGGIGITPFRSMAGHMLAEGRARDAVLLYGANSEKDIAYRRFFGIARERLGMKVVYVSGKKSSRPDTLEGRIDERVIREQVPDYADRIFYLSGPQAMVTAFVASLKKLGLPAGQIKTDYFPGFA
jgi:ferredoxin-NADP reductase